MTTKKVLIFVALIALVLLMINPVSALTNVYPSWWGTLSQMKTSGYWIEVGDNETEIAEMSWSIENAICDDQFPGSHRYGYDSQLFTRDYPNLNDITYGYIIHDDTEAYSHLWNETDSGYFVNNQTYRNMYGGGMPAIMAIFFQCIIGGGEDGNLYHIVPFMYNLSASSSPPAASFECVPTSQYLNTDVVCTDTSTNSPTSWLWTIDYPALGITGWQTSTTRNFSWQSAYAGTFSVNLRATNVGGSDWENKTNYVSISTTPYVTVTPTPVPTIPPGYVRTTVAAWDLNGNMISGVNINIYDVEAAVWKNSTEDADGIEYIDTLPYHTLNIYGTYTVHPNVYTDAELLGMETGYYGNYYYLTLFPYTASPPGAGNTNLYIQVLENINKLPVPGVFLQVSFLGNATIGVYTNSAGVQVVTVPNNTVMSITATKAGWLGNVVTIDSGPGPTSVVGIGIDRAYVTTTPTITAGLGGTIPTTYLPGIGPTSSASQISKAQDNEMMNKIRTAGPYLIDFAILATVMGLLYLVTGTKR